MIKLCQNFQKITETHTSLEEFIICCTLALKSWLTKVICQDLPLGFTHVGHNIQLAAKLYII
jgi:hypothetical protein